MGATGYLSRDSELEILQPRFPVRATEPEHRTAYGNGMVMRENATSGAHETQEWHAQLGATRIRRGRRGVAPNGAFDSYVRELAQVQD